MHVGQVFRVVSILLLIVALFMVFPILFAIYYGEVSLIRYFLLPMGISLMFAGGSLFLTRKSKKVLSTRDGFLLVSASWVLSALIG